MADYNIYIHNLGGTAEQNPIKAWVPGTNQQASPTKAWQEDGGSGGESLSAATSAFKGEVSETITGTAGGAALMKASPVVAAAIAVVGLSIKVNDGIMAYMSKETGNFRIQKNYNNLKATLNAALHPASMWITRLKTELDTKIYNWKQREEELLIGEGDINYSRRKY